MRSQLQTRRCALMESCPLADTVTVPSKEMHKYAGLSSLNDDVMFDEPSTKSLEKHIAKLLGKDAALFVSSGTMSNQVALRTHLAQPPHSVLCDIRSHIHWQAVYP